MTTTENPDLLGQFSGWSPEGQSAAADALTRARESPWRPWYCGTRTCDGMPHDAWTHNHARGDQHPPAGDWDVWLELSGRGSGKTRSGAEWTHKMTKTT